MKGHYRHSPLAGRAHAYMQCFARWHPALASPSLREPCIFDSSVCPFAEKVSVESAPMQTKGENPGATPAGAVFECALVVFCVETGARPVSKAQNVFEAL